MDTDFYHVKNIEIGNFLGDADKATPYRTLDAEYNQFNDLFQELFVNVRFGPPLTPKGRVGVALLSKGYAGVYMQKKDRSFVIGEKFNEAKVTLSYATSELDGIIERGIEALGYEQL